MRLSKLGRFVFLSLFAAACGADHADHGAVDPGDGGTGGGGSSKGSVVTVDCPAATIAVTVTTPGFRFEPKTATIQAGDVVRFDPSSGQTDDCWNGMGGDYMAKKNKNTVQR